MPTRRDSTPLFFLPAMRKNPHTWVKLWKHHAAQPQANRINDIGRDRGEEFITIYVGEAYYPLGAKAGDLTAEWAAKTGLLQGTPVSIGNVDAHVAVPATGIAHPAATPNLLGARLGDAWSRCRRPRCRRLRHDL